MTQQTSLTVEDLIRIIGGYCDPKTLKSKSIWDQKEPLISLARYDVEVVDSFCNQVQAYTDRQAGLAKLIVEKYRRQLSKHGVVVPDELVFRGPLRKINRDSRAWADDTGVYLQFPFVRHQIDMVRETQRTSQGNIQWLRDQKVWKLDLTEFNVNWAHVFASTNSQFVIDPSLQQLMDSITEVEQRPYAIQLTVENDKLTILNASDSLIEYINERGGLTDDNLLRLVDLSGTLAYTINDVIKETVSEVYGPRFLSLCINRELKVEPGSDFKGQVKQIVEYATATNRLPIYVYEPDLSGKLLDMFKECFNGEDVHVVKNKEWTPPSPNTKMIYTHKIPREHNGTIPLLVSGAGMMFGGERQLWLQNAEKIVYFAKDIYNKSSKGREVCKLN